MKKHLFIIVVLFSIVLSSCNLGSRTNQPESENWQWRGENRDGMYNETGLLQSWSAGGPELLWYFEGLGEGHTSVAIANEKIYTTGMHDDRLILYVFDMDGKLLTEKEVGKEWDSNWNGTRSSVCINDGKLYIFNALGTLFCLDEKTLNEVWKKDLLAEFGGRNLRFGITENPLIVGDKIFMTPGGETHNMVALNKNTGELIWSSPGKGTLSSYCSPQYISGYSVPIVVTSTFDYIIGLNADTGEMLWSHPQTNQHNIHVNTPLYSDGMIFFSTGYGGGSMLLRLINNGRAVEQVWRNEELDNQMGCAIRVGDYLYASGHRNRHWFCVDWKTGETKYKVEGDSGECNVIFADGMLYVYSDKGTVSLVRPNPDRYELISSFEVTLGTNQHWAHPVIHQGVMYIRHGDALMAYKVK
jgi:outer membrane protein assembly factor BamB